MHILPNPPGRPNPPLPPLPFHISNLALFSDQVENREPCTHLILYTALPFSHFKIVSKVYQAPYLFFSFLVGRCLICCSICLSRRLIQWLLLGCCWLQAVSQFGEIRTYQFPAHGILGVVCRLCCMQTLSYLVEQDNDPLQAWQECFLEHSMGSSPY